MDERLVVEPAAVGGLAGTMAERRASADGLGAVMAEGRGADTGDAALDADLDALADRFTEVFASLARALDGTSTRLTRAADTYRELDQGLADRYDALATGYPAGVPSV